MNIPVFKRIYFNLICILYSALEILFLDMQWRLIGLYIIILYNLLQKNLPRTSPAAPADAVEQQWRRQNWVSFDSSFITRLPGFFP